MEKIISLSTRTVYEITVNKNGENNMPCPECSPNRRKKHLKCFSYNHEKEVGYCSHCETRFVKYENSEPKVYHKPEPLNFTKLSDNAVKWFESRGIYQKTLISAKIQEVEEFMPQIEKKANCIVFPYYRNGELINMKFRDGRKNFKLVSGAELIWWNFDALKNFEEIIIVEGEMDALSAMQAGFENVISVPNGASIGKMDYFDSSFLELEKVKSFIIATDNDLKGIELKNEFIRRLGFEKCKIANLRQYKDLNEVLIAEGRESVQNTIKNAKILKADDVYELQDFYNDIDAYFESGLPQGKKLGILELDEKIRWMTSHLAVVTGSPTSGKSEFVDFIISKLNVLHGWKCAYYSQENSSIPIHFARIFSKFVGKKYKKGVITIAEKETGENYINDNIFWVQPDFDINPDEILKKFEYLVKAKGVKVFVVDPFNRIEQGANYGTQMQFIQKTLGKLISFCRKTDSLLFLVAHPTKLRKNEKNGKFPIATAYDISGSADFWNMPSYVISVRREQDDETLEFLTYGQVVISKAKVNETMGDTGIWNFRYNVNNGRYITDDKEKSCNFDNTNWITKEEYKEPEEPKLQALNPYEAFGMPKNNLFCKDGTEQDDDMPF